MLSTPCISAPLILPRQDPRPLRTAPRSFPLNYRAFPLPTDIEKFPLNSHYPLAFPTLPRLPVTHLSVNSVFLVKRTIAPLFPVAKFSKPRWNPRPLKTAPRSFPLNFRASHSFPLNYRASPLFPLRSPQS